MDEEKDVPAGNFATWFREILAMVQELDARRRFDEDVAAWLKETDRVKDFEAYRAARRAPREAKTEP